MNKKHYFMLKMKKNVKGNNNLEQNDKCWSETLIPCKLQQTFLTLVTKDKHTYHFNISFTNTISCFKRHFPSMQILKCITTITCMFPMFTGIAIFTAWSTIPQACHNIHNVSLAPQFYITILTSGPMHCFTDASQCRNNTKPHKNKHRY